MAAKYVSESIQRAELLMAVERDATRAERGVYERLQAHVQKQRTQVLLVAAFQRWRDCAMISRLAATKQAADVRQARVTAAVHEITREVESQSTISKERNHEETQLGVHILDALKDLLGPGLVDVNTARINS
jgi:hypothetical protein